MIASKVGKKTVNRMVTEHDFNSKPSSESLYELLKPSKKKKSTAEAVLISQDFYGRTQAVFFFYFSGT